MSRLKETRKPNPHRKEAQKGIRFSAEELQHVTAMAKLYTAGRVAQFVRYAALNFKPSKNDLTK